MIVINPEATSAIRRVHLPDLLAKKSRSTVARSWRRASPLQFVSRLAIPTSVRVKRPKRLILKLLLPRINLVHMHLVALRPDPSPLILLADASKAIFAFSAASIFRLIFFMIRSVYQNGTASAPLKPLVQNPGSTLPVRLPYRRRTRNALSRACTQRPISVLPTGPTIADGAGESTHNPR